MMKLIICILLSLFATGLFTCSATNEISQKPIREKPVSYFMPGIDDTCDTSRFKCIDMNSREYDSIMHFNKRIQF